MRIGELFKRIPKCKNCKYFEPDDNASWGSVLELSQTEVFLFTQIPLQ